MEYTEKYCIGCCGTLSPADRLSEVMTLINTSQFLEEQTPEYNEPLIDAGGVCSHCGRKGAVIYYKMQVTKYSQIIQHDHQPVAHVAPSLRGRHQRGRVS
jgi:hypothetical protein